MIEVFARARELVPLALPVAVVNDFLPKVVGADTVAAVPRHRAPASSG